jgi:tripartite-type tricarboxylate transporter receptor subunit TctC
MTDERLGEAMARVHTLWMLAVSILLCCVSSLSAQEWPTRPITLVVAFPAGGADDALARILAPRLSEILGKQVVIENVSGRGGMAGAARVARAAPDGYEIVLGSSSIHAASQSLYKTPLYRSDVDFAPVALLVEQPFVLIGRKDFQANNLQSFLTYARSHEATMQYGSAGSGSATHLACERLNAAAGIKAKHVPYNGGGPALQDLIAGKIDYQCAVVTLPLAKIRANEVNAIAIMSLNRSTALPDIASAHEQGMVSFDASTWFALFVPKDTSATIIRKLNTVAFEALDTLSVRERLTEIGATPVSANRRSAEYLQIFLKSEIQKWAATVNSAGLKLD